MMVTVISYDSFRFYSIHPLHDLIEKRRAVNYDSPASYFCLLSDIIISDSYVSYRQQFLLLQVILTS